MPRVRAGRPGGAQVAGVVVPGLEELAVAALGQLDHAPASRDERDALDQRVTAAELAALLGELACGGSALHVRDDLPRSVASVRRGLIGRWTRVRALVNGRVAIPVPSAAGGSITAVLTVAATGRRADDAHSAPAGAGSAPRAAARARAIDSPSA